MSVIDAGAGSSTPSTSIKRRETEGEVELGLGLPEATASARSNSTKRDVTAIYLGPSQGGDSTESASDPFDSPSPVAPPTPRGLSRSSTQPSVTIIHSSPRVPTVASRQPSMRRVSKSPLAQSAVPEESSEPKLKSAVREVRPPRIRHSRTQSHLSALALPVDVPPVPPLPTLPSLSQASSTSSSSFAPSLASAPTHTSVPTAMDRTPSRPRKAFPTELTRGIIPSASSPNLASPLAPSRRIPSGKRPAPPSSPGKRGGNEKDALGLPLPNGKGVRSVEEKKELVS
jgi:hypothetical protein